MRYNIAGIKIISNFAQKFRHSIMNRTIFIRLFSAIWLFSIAQEGFSQDLLWKVGVYNLFDNSEFDRSDIRASRTITSTQLQPLIGLGIEEKHRIMAGVDLVKE